MHNYYIFIFCGVFLLLVSLGASLNDSLHKYLKDKNYDFTKSNFVIGISLIFISMYVIPLLLSINDFFSDFITNNNLNAVGDAIGGTTAPIINGIGAYLVYIAFKEQIKANNFLKEEIDQSNFFNIYEEINKLMDFTNEQIDSLEEITNEQIDSFEEISMSSTDIQRAKEVLNGKQMAEKILENDGVFLSPDDRKEILNQYSYIFKLMDNLTRSIEQLEDKNDIQYVNNHKTELVKQNQEKEINTNKSANKKNSKSNKEFNFKGLIRAKYWHFYKTKYAKYIKVKEKKCIAENFDFYNNKNESEYTKLISSLNNDEIRINWIKTVRSITISIKNIEDSLKENNEDFWGKQIKI
jgi:hypothetical protein